MPIPWMIYGLDSKDLVSFVYEVIIPWNGKLFFSSHGLLIYNKSSKNNRQYFLLLVWDTIFVIHII